MPAAGSPTHQALEDLCDALSKGRGEHARVRYEGSVPFGFAAVSSGGSGAVPEVARFRLGNGLAILLLTDAAAPVLCVQTWFRVGSRHERAGKTGIAHLFEHLMFGETENHEEGELDRLLEEAGAETNAATFLDWTYYHTNLPKDALELVLSLEADRLEHLVLNAPQVAREKEVVMNERRQRVDDDLDGAVSEILYKTAFDVHPYGHPTIGWMEDIQGFVPEDCATFYGTYYAPNNATLVVVGDTTAGVLLPIVQARYGHLAPSELPVEDARPEPPQTSERYVSVEKPTAAVKLALGYRCPALGDADHVPLSLLGEVLFGGASSRAYRRLVRQAEVATEVRGWVGAFAEPALFDCWLSGREGVQASDLLRRFDELIEEVIGGAITEEELEKAKAKLELSTLQGLETIAERAEGVGFYDAVLGEPDAPFRRLAQARRATRSDLLRVARRYLVRHARTVVEVLPQKSGEQAA